MERNPYLNKHFQVTVEYEDGDIKVSDKSYTTTAIASFIADELEMDTSFNVNSIKSITIKPCK